MKLAFFSPFPPKQTGIAGYSQALVTALRNITEVTKFDHDNPTLMAQDPGAIDFSATPEVCLRLNDWDAAIFSLGNNPYFHLDILRVFHRSRGILLLHDTVLYYLFAGLQSGLFYRYFCLNFGSDRSVEFSALFSESPEGNVLRYGCPERYPFLLTPVKHAEAVIVHSHFAARMVRSLAPETPVHVLPLLALAPGTDPRRNQRANELRKKVLTRTGQTLIGTFGFLGPTKRLPSIATALRDVSNQIDFHFIIVGDGPDPLPEFVTAGIADRVTWLRYVTDEDFDAWIEASDLVLNLRFPSMGESSATLSRAMGMGKACIITDHAAFSEFPDATVWKIPPGQNESEALVGAIVQLCDNSAKCREIGQAAQHHVHTVQSPDHVAARLVEIVGETRDKKLSQTNIPTQAAAYAAARIRNHFDERLRDALPPHLLGKERSCNGDLPAPVSLGLSTEELTWAFRVMLLRDPHPELEAPRLLREVGSLKQLRKILSETSEFAPHQ